MNIDEKFMKIALKEAEKCLLIDEVPVGAVLVKDGKVIAKAHNMRETSFDPTAHAEIQAIRKACKKKKSWRLEDVTLYVTLEPCSMCAGAILWARIERVVFGASDPKGGALGSSYNLFEQKNLNHYPKVTRGVLSELSSQYLKEFFQNKRK